MPAPALSVFIQTLALTGIFPVRAFLPAFATALLLRYGQHLPVIRSVELLRDLSANAPAWFIHPATLWILGILSFAELLAKRDEDLRSFLDAADNWVKPVLAAATTIGLLTAADGDIIQTVGTPGPAMILSASALCTGLWVGLVATLTFLFNRLHQKLVDAVMDVDEDNDLGLLTLLAWAEDGWVLVLLFLLFLFPALVLFLAAVGGGVLWLLKLHLDRREARTLVPCEQCGNPRLRAAMVCPTCTQAIAAPHRLGAFGQSLNQPATDLVDHRFRLLSFRRCPACANRLAPNSLHAPCPACHKIPLADSALLPEPYLAWLRQRVPWILGAAALFSLIPLIGLIPGIILYRYNLVAPLRRHVSFRAGLFGKLLAKVLHMLLILVFGWMPFASVIVAPAMGWTDFMLFRRLFRKRACRTR